MLECPSKYVGLTMTESSLVVVAAFGLMPISERPLGISRNDYAGSGPSVNTTHAWSGRVGMSFDLTPHIGRIDGAWYVNGFSGHGIGLSVQLGHELAGMLLGEDPPSVFATTRHSGRFYYSGRSSWFLTPATYLNRALDRIRV